MVRPVLHTACLWLVNARGRKTIAGRQFGRRAGPSDDYDHDDCDDHDDYDHDRHKFCLSQYDNITILRFMTI